MSTPINYPDNFLSNDTINVFEAYNAATIFLYTIWKKHKEKFSENDYDYLAQFCSYLTGDRASIDDWRCSYLKITGRELNTPRDVFPLKFYPRLDKENMLQKIAFKTMQDLCEWHLHEFGYEFPQLIELLDSMLTNPAMHQPEWELWDQAVDRARSGEIMGAC